MSDAPATETGWPGKRFGMPQTGPRSMARFGRRLAALIIDWAFATIVSLIFFSTGPWQTDPLITLVIFAFSQIVGLILLGGGLGHVILRMRVLPLRGRYVGLWRPFVRTILLCLAIPALIVDNDGRGLHDVAAGTVLVRI